MTKEEYAEQFAEEKIAELANVIKEAYKRGYEQGCLDASNTLSIDDVEYVDLGLPSGPLWSKTPREYFDYGYKQTRLSYQEAAKLEIPTEKQWEEVLQYCHFEQHLIIGPSGQRIGYGWAPAGYRIYNLGESCKNDRNLFWLRGEVDSENNAPAMLYDLEGEYGKYVIHKGTAKHFIGFKLPIFLVKNKV